MKICDYKGIDLSKNKRLMPVASNTSMLNRMDFNPFMKDAEIVFFDSLGLDVTQWKSDDKLRIVMFPLGNLIKQRNMRSMYWKRKNAYCTDATIDFTSDYEVCETFIYLPDKNLIITKCNVFCDTVVYDNFVSELMLTMPKFYDNEQLMFRKFELIWNSNISREISQLTTSIRSTRNNISSYRSNLLNENTRLFELHKKVAAYEEIKKNIAGSLAEKIDELKKLPFIKKVTFDDSILVNIGDVYITSTVITGYEYDNNIKLPKTEPVKVFIGNISFSLSGQTLSVKNNTLEKKGVYDIIHPHAADDMICFGEIEYDVYTEFGKMNLAKLFKLLYSWAFSYNSEDTVVKIQKFYDYNKGGPNETSNERK